MRIFLSKNNIYSLKIVSVCQPKSLTSRVCLKNLIKPLNSSALYKKLKGSTSPETPLVRTGRICKPDIKINPNQNEQKYAHANILQGAFKLISPLLSVECGERHMRPTLKFEHSEILLLLWSFCTGIRNQHLLLLLQDSLLS